MDKNGITNIYYTDQDLEKQLALTTQDIRFMQALLKSSENSKQNPAGREIDGFKTCFLDFNGNDDWVRLQFYSYLCSIFRASQLKDDHLSEYNEDFIKTWSVTHNYRVWSRGNYEKLNEFQSM